MKFRRYLLIFLAFIFIFLFSSCKKNEIEEKTKHITILTVNDFHGAITDKASKLGNVIINEKEKNADEVVVLSAGDMFQGSAISNYNRGKDMVDIMNMIGFDAMTVGNHEFDWELSTILNYFDKDSSNGEANFPLLGCNVVDKTTNEIPTNMESYKIIEKNGLKIAVIGYIGYGLEDSIATKMVENYEFLEPTPLIKELSTKLRKEELVDIVIASGHDASSDTNKKIASLSGDARIDAIVNGHTHVKTQGYIERDADGVSVPYVQAGSSGEAVGKIELNYDTSAQKIESSKASHLLITNVTKENASISAKVDEITEKTSAVFEEVIGTAGRSLTKYEGTSWVCNAILKYCLDNYESCDIAFTNVGGVRDAAFPIKKDEAITVNRLYQLMPFDNTIKMVTLKGSVIKALINNPGELYYSSLSVKKNGNNIYINGNLLDEESDYRVACVDYIFDKPTYPFLKGNNIFNSGILLRDLLIDNIKNCTQNGKSCFMEGENNE